VNLFQIVPFCRRKRPLRIVLTQPSYSYYQAYHKNCKTTKWQLICLQSNKCKKILLSFSFNKNKLNSMMRREEKKRGRDSTETEQQIVLVLVAATRFLTISAARSSLSPPCLAPSFQLTRYANHHYQ